MPLTEDVGRRVGRVERIPSRFEAGAGNEAAACAGRSLEWKPDRLRLGEPVAGIPVQLGRAARRRANVDLECRVPCRCASSNCRAAVTIESAIAERLRAEIRHVRHACRTGRRRGPQGVLARVSYGTSNVRPHANSDHRWCRLRRFEPRIGAEASEREVDDRGLRQPPPAWKRIRGRKTAGGRCRVRPRRRALSDDLADAGAFDLLLECSAEPSVHAGYDGSPAYVIQTNLIGTANCLEAARRCGADVIFLSTSRVYPIAGPSCATAGASSDCDWTCRSRAGHRVVCATASRQDFPLSGCSFHVRRDQARL